jgi:PPOX class probable F420-dependent enzyme
MPLADETYVSLTTFRRSGEPVATPVWVVPVSDGRLGVWTASESGKVKRLRHDPRVSVQPCNARGQVGAGTEPATGTAEMVRSGRWYDEVMSGVDTKYGLLGRLTKLGGRLRRFVTRTPADPGTVLLVRLDD